MIDYHLRLDYMVEKFIPCNLVYIFTTHHPVVIHDCGVDKRSTIHIKIFNRKISFNDLTAIEF